MRKLTALLSYPFYWVMYLLIWVADRLPEKKKIVPAPSSPGLRPEEAERPYALVIHRPLSQRMAMKAKRERRYAQRLEREINALIGDVERN